MENINKLLLGIVSASLLTACQTSGDIHARYSTVTARSTVSQRIADAQKDGYVYGQDGMEVSAVVSAMSNTLYDTMFANLFHSAPETQDAEGNTVRNIAFPKVAIASFFDTDTYEDVGVLGRDLSEFFVHELNKRGVNVFEYKLTGKISVTRQGEYIMSRDYTKLANKAMVTHILTGSVTRNERGVVLVARIVNIKDQTVLGTATGFIPYRLIPNCYRRDIRSCSIRDVSGRGTYRYSGNNPNVVNGRLMTGGTAPASPASTDPQPLKTYAQKDRAARNNKIYRERGETSNGNYDDYIDEINTKSWGERWFGRCTGSNCDSPVIYRAASTQNPRTGNLIRDIEDQSQYERLKHK